MCSDERSLFAPRISGRESARVGVDTWCSFTDVRREFRFGACVYSTSRQLAPICSWATPRPNLCTSCGATQSGAESQRLQVGEQVWSGPVGGHSVSSPALRAWEPSPLWSPGLWPLEETMMLYSLDFCPILPWVGAKKELWNSDPGCAPG